MRRRNGYVVESLVLCAALSLVLAGSAWGKIDFTEKPFDDLVSGTSTVTICDYGPQVRTACVVMQGLNMEDLFSSNMKAVDVFNKWYDSCNNGEYAKQLEKDYKDQLKVLRTALDEMAKVCGTWTCTYRDLFSKAYSSYTDPEKAAMKAVEDAGFYLCFLHANPSTANGVIDQILKNEKLAKMELCELYYTPASPSAFADADLALANTALHLESILGSGEIDFLALKDGVTYLSKKKREDSSSEKKEERKDAKSETQATTKGMCCSKSAGRICKPTAATLNCTMCGLYCCIGSNWC